MPDPPDRFTPHKFRANLLDEATIVERGEQVKVWFVPWGDTWVRAKDHPDAGIDEVSSEGRSNRCPPGTVWQRSIELSLDAGTPLLCRITRPLVEALRTLDYMTKDRRSVRRHIEERWYRLAGNYRMVRCGEPESFTEARSRHEQTNATQKI